MCLLVIAWKAHPRYRLVVAANRDEFHARPAEPLKEWTQAPHLLAGRDLQAGGTWLALDRTHRFGVITNYREMQRPAGGVPSRGNIIPEFLSQSAPAHEYLAALRPRAGRYSGFNLILHDGAALWYAANRASPFLRELLPGVYALSNHLLDTPWPKVVRVRRTFEAWLERTPPGDVDALLAILADRTQAGAGELLPETGLSAEWERALSAPFVQHAEYGTRSSTVVLLEHDGTALVRERRFDAEGIVTGETEVHRSPVKATNHPARDG